MSDGLRKHLVVIINAYGGGSFARCGENSNETKEQTIKRAAKIYREDWKHIFPNIGKKGTPVTVNVIDVTDLDEVTWNDRGFWVKDGDKNVALNENLLTIETYTY